MRKTVNYQTPDPLMSVPGTPDPPKVVLVVSWDAGDETRAMTELVTAAESINGQIKAAFDAAVTALFASLTGSLR